VGVNDAERAWRNARCLGIRKSDQNHERQVQRKGERNMEGEKDNLGGKKKEIKEKDGFGTKNKLLLPGAKSHLKFHFIEARKGLEEGGF